MDLLNILSYTTGLFQLPWWGYILLALTLTHITIVSVTLYLHRCQTHRGIHIHPIIAHFMRFWLWLTTGMVTKQWVAIHRKHHHKVETKEDPHSPKHWGLATVLWQGAELYRKEADNKETMQTYGQGTPDDWIEHHLYTQYNYLGCAALFFIQFALFGWWGISIWAVQMLWIPFFAAGVINGACHAVGYRNFATKDNSTNLVNIGILIGGEELHNNHHAYPGSARFSIKPWEFDIGWMYIQILAFFGLAKVRSAAPATMDDLITASHESHGLHSLETIKTLLNHRLHVMAEYTNSVIKPVLSKELRNTHGSLYNKLLKERAPMLLDAQTPTTLGEHKRLQEVLHLSSAIQVTYEFKTRLQELWQEHKHEPAEYCEALREWCQHARQTGILSLQDFASRIQKTIPVPVPAQV